MRIYILLFLGMTVTAILFHLISGESEYNYFWMVILLFAIIGELVLIANMRKRGSGKVKTFDEDNENDEKIDFSKNSPTINPDELEEPPQVKPIDLTGNVFEHNFETLEDDLSFLKKEKSHSDED